MPSTAFLCLKISLMNSLKFTISTVAVCRNFERLNKHYVRGTKSEGSGIWSKYLILYSTVMCRAMEMLRISQLKRKQVAFFGLPGYCSIFFIFGIDEYISFGYKYYFFLYFVHFYLYILTKGCSQASLSYTWKSYSVRAFCVLLCCELV